MRSPRLTVQALLVTLSLGGCSFVRDFVAGPLDERLAKEAVAHWATPGSPFMDGALGQDAVETVAETGEWAWEVTVAGGVQALEVAKAEVFPVFPGDDFSTWITTRARELGFRSFIPPDVRSMVTEGRISAVGDLEVKFGPADGGGRSTVERVAYLTVDGGKKTWAIQAESRTAMVLRDALNVVYSDMILTDDRVMDCLGAVGPGTARRSRALGCIAEALALEFRQGSS